MMDAVYRRRVTGTDAKRLMLRRRGTQKGAQSFQYYIIAAEIVEGLQAALAQFAEIAAHLGSFRC